MLEMLLISASGVWLGLFSLIFFSSLVWASERDSFFLGTAVLLIGLAVAQFVLGVPVWATLTANLLMLGLYVVLYIAAGALYAGMWRLPNFVRKNGNAIKESYESWKRVQLQQNDRTWRETVRDKVVATETDNRPAVDVSYETFLDSSSYNYSVRRNKDRVASWVLLWPASVTWELMHKPFIWVWESVYYGLGEVFERINRDQARKILEEKSK